MPPHWFTGRTAILATMHRKEEAIAPLLQSALELEVIVPREFNSDQFGTFTRDVKRPADQLATARLKALHALEQLGAALGADLAIASEGSFGPHPLMPYVPLNRELVLLVDRRHGLEVAGYAATPDTNYSHKQVESIDAAMEFARSVGFPSHGLVVMPAADSSDPAKIHKGITQEAMLREIVAITLQRHGRAHLETDMRAMMNPTRMKAIALATQDLIRKLQQTCPQCGAPGFDVSDRQPGLPCGLCHAPTDLTLAALYRCAQCGFSKTVRYPDGQKFADPTQCAYCNP
jgi:ribosomal protein S27AE/DNA-directed RNA polymerase subunit RPC12/RpoP